MVRQALASFAVMALGLARDPGCGSTVDAPNGGTNAPCTRSSDCSSGLVCLEGVCRDPDGGGSTPPDGGSDAEARDD